MKYIVTSFLQAIANLIGLDTRLLPRGRSWNTFRTIAVIFFIIGCYIGRRVFFLVNAFPAALVIVGSILSTMILCAILRWTTQRTQLQDGILIFELSSTVLGIAIVLIYYTSVNFCLT
jgi:hypothetical protein